jgi:hypothetical protein
MQQEQGFPLILYSAEVKNAWSYTSVWLHGVMLQKDREKVALLSLKTTKLIAICI